MLQRIRYGNVEYTLNALTYGWWLRGLYLNDADLAVLEHNSTEQHGLAGTTTTHDFDARSRLLKTVVAGGLLLNGDNLTSAGTRDAVGAVIGGGAGAGTPATLLRSVLDATAGPAFFRPVQCDGDASEVFVLRRSGGGGSGGGGSSSGSGSGSGNRTSYYLAIFHYFDGHGGGGHSSVFATGSDEALLDLSHADMPAGEAGLACSDAWQLGHEARVDGGTLAVRGVLQGTSCLLHCTVDDRWA